MDTVYYCGFNGFRQVPGVASPTVTALTAADRGDSAGLPVLDLAICWNYLLLADADGLTKYGLVNGKNGGAERLVAPEGRSVAQLSATPRHILACTNNGECWTHEEGKGWRQVSVGAEKEIIEDAAAPEPKEDSAASDSTAAPETSTESQPKAVCLVKTSCGDAHNLGLDTDGRAYSLPSPLDVDVFPGSSKPHRVTDVVCGKEHCLLLTEHGQVCSWGGGSRGQLGHGSLSGEEKPRLVSALDGLRVRKIAAGGWHSAVISYADDLYMFGWNESGQLAQTTNLANKPAECFTAVEKLLMACCTMQPEDTPQPRGDSEDCEVYHKNDEDSVARSEFCDADLSDHPEKDAVNCYNAVSSSCNDTQSDVVVVQHLPMLVQLPPAASGGKTSSSGKGCHSSEEARVVDVACGSRHTVVLASDNQLYGFGWNKYGQLGLGHTLPRDAMERIPLPKGLAKNCVIKMVRCGDWGTVLVTSSGNKKG